MVFVITMSVSEYVTDVVYTTRYLDELLEKIEFLRMFNPSKKFEWNYT